jgi:hypothetical protein
MISINTENVKIRLFSKNECDTYLNNLIRLYQDGEFAKAIKHPDMDGYLVKFKGGDLYDYDGEINFYLSKEGIEKINAEYIVQEPELKKHSLKLSDFKKKPVKPRIQ